METAASILFYTSVEAGRCTLCFVCNEIQLVCIVQIVAPSFVPSAKTEILNKIKGHNELSILARFTRSPHVASPKMVSVELSLTNHDKKEALTNIYWTQKVKQFQFEIAIVDISDVIYNSYSKKLYTCDHF